MLKIENLNFSYGDLKVLWDVNVEVTEGEIVTVAEQTAPENRRSSKISPAWRNPDRAASPSTAWIWPNLKRMKWLNLALSRFPKAERYFRK